MSASSAFDMNGVPVYAHALAVKLVRGRLHQIKPWMAQRCYHQRIEKKWAKRFGQVKFSPCAFFGINMFGGGRVLYAHPLLIDELKAKIGTRNFDFQRQP